MSASDIAISARGLSKAYTVTHDDRPRATNLGEAVGRRLRAPFRPSMSSEMFWALKNVSFDIKRGEVVGIIGRNGAGKSTLLKVLSRITEPTAGEARAYGRIGSLLEVGTGFHPELTGRENVFLNGAILGMTRAEIRRQFDAIVDFAGVERFLDTPVKRYSSGMYVRLAFAVAAHLNPEVLIVDEVLAVGDAEFQRKCLGKMRDVASEGRTVLVVSHNLSTINELCDTALELAEGSIIHIGPASDVITDHVSRSLAYMRDHSRGTVRLTPELSLVSLATDPCVIVCGEDAEVALTLRADRSLRLEHVCVLIYSAMGARVSIVDLRGQHNGYELEAGQCLRLNRRLSPVNLVPASYNLGLHVVYGRSVTDHVPLAQFEVVAADRAYNHTAYATQACGFVEFAASPVRQEFGWPSHATA